MTVPAKIDIVQAKLPATYEQAKLALASCASIDECQDWANKAEALASYAKMADDETLFDYAKRIHGRAVRRMGELLNQIEPSKGGRPSENSGVAHPSLEGWIPGGSQNEPSLDGWIPQSRKEAADAVGLSDHRRKQALRVANVPQERFESAVEAEKPATVTALAEMGKQVRSAPIEAKPAEQSEVANLANGLRVALAGLDPILDRIAQIGVDAFWREADERVRKQIEGTAEFLQVLTTTSSVQHQPAQPEAAA
ncbi:hypothetical protein CQ12_05520 [Bradyrhizobium jicamae]|uniref:Uncharacterized protein n=1 Tax=Bradyrhizobium jicamae TaxID=280332 RepID=A0A0R3M2K0_9BRAD|nr:hypothetical protein [Bradyrhizobium jicamae]KRR11286.1 hypothetical protein CQ12_05520 [Bradyrhizobium jicamae]